MASQYAKDHDFIVKDDITHLPEAFVGLRKKRTAAKLVEKTSPETIDEFV